MNRYLKHLVIVFSFFLGFGLYDPFGTNGLYFDLLTILSMLLIATQTKAIIKAKYFKKELLLLFAIGLVVFLADLFYGYSYAERWDTHIKYMAAIFIFWFFSFIFRENRKLALYSLLSFSISCAMIALIYSLGGFSNVSELSGNGRLIIFGENPNSVSTRMAISFVFISYLIINNPLQLGKLRYFLLMFIPSLFSFVVLTGSRGSFLAMTGGLGLLVFLSNIKFSYKMTLGALSVMGIIFAMTFVEDSSLLERFQQENVLASRTSIWSNALQVFYDNPLGVGHGGYLNEMQQRYNSWHDTHNLFIQILVVGGVFGLVFYFLFLYRLSQKALNKLKQKQSLEMILLLFMIFIMAKTGGVITYLIMWYFLAFINGYDIKNTSNNNNLNSVKDR